MQVSKTSQYHATDYLTYAIRLALIGMVCVPVHTAVQASDANYQVTSVFYDPDSAVNQLQPNRSDMRIPQRMQGRVVVRAPRPIQVDPVLTAPVENLEQRRFSLDAVRMLDAQLFDEQELMAVMTPWTERQLSFAEFQLAALTLLEHLREHGHPEAVLRFSQMQFLENQQVAVAIEGLAPTDSYQDGAPRIQVAGFDVRGVTLLDDAQVQAHLAPWSGRALSVDELSEAAEAVAQLLRDQGYALAQAWLPPQEIAEGRVQIEVLEGVVDGLSGQQGITVADTQRIKSEVIAGYLAEGVVAGEPININALERQVRLLNEMPGIRSVQADLAPGSVAGTTQVIAEVEEQPLLTTALTVDNYGSKFSGEERLGINLNLNSPMGYGEQFFVNYTGSDGTNSYKLGVHAPVGYSGLRVGASYAALDVELKEGSIAPLNQSSDSESFSLFANYPLARSAAQTIDLFASLDHKTYKNNYPDFGFFDNQRDISSLTLGASGSQIDRYQGRTGWGISLTQGDLSLKGSGDSSTEGSFTKGNFNISRLQALPADQWFVYASLSGQLASGNLDSAEKFQLGGPMGVRAWPVGEAIGDHGWLANLELRRNLGNQGDANFEAFGFYDIGGVTQYANSGSAPAYSGPNTYELGGYGVGLSMTYSDTGNVRLVYAQKDRSNPNPTASGTDSDGTDQSGRIWLIGTLLF
ncbi:Hemolysin activation/secretion protein [Nitrincola lacisaponensis]|uniref:Hemolysin activation/secretion protein n=2 Tax=Nitrincola lacisaponensis TaxID=267850 RepID=A0A063Y479_9GAMM|nr:Hemolysin activation/secretion protein [Nitrincola lacisaponensis]